MRNFGPEVRLRSLKIISQIILNIQNDDPSTGNDYHLTGRDGLFLENQNYIPIRTPKVITFDRKFDPLFENQLTNQFDNQK